MFISSYAAINAISLILTSLPPSFQQRFFDHIVSVVASKELRDGKSNEVLQNAAFLFFSKLARKLA